MRDRERRKNGSSREEGEKRKREEEKEEDETVTVKRRCEGFVSVEAFDFLVTGKTSRVVVTCLERTTRTCLIVSLILVHVRVVHDVAVCLFPVLLW